MLRCDVQLHLFANACSVLGDWVILMWFRCHPHNGQVFQ